MSETDTEPSYLPVIATQPKGGKRSRRQGGARKEIAMRQVIEAKAAGMSFAEIGDHIGVSRQYAHRLFREAMTRHQADLAPLVAEVRAQSLATYNAVILAHYPRRMDPKSAHVLLAAVDKRARLVGAEAPTKVEHSGSVGHGPVSTGELAAIMRRLEEEQAQWEAMGNA